MPTLILPHRLPPHERRSWPERSAGTRSNAPSSLLMAPHSSADHVPTGVQTAGISRLSVLTESP
ncbi:hypothetical protein ALQ64_102015 [Pseudomonas cannabina]|uniref:Uncharacterized protein n=1 Tax=Pseudomonas cannabina TaxID=86840 RepID=A0A0P9QT34_PSECA|nr:Uncharacterized protein AC507_1977 [Pseudomonas syringae pv. maculicola]KPW19605.1 hypothetical protein ALO83_103111 [Pseudomonas cannabina pv. alisalensis]KPW73938.1 hypothetical protein ALO81_101825 [Pseudomonas cannabina]RMN21231.1 hypothetical protein ALQ64_102015 [Pseudomonas cannabina]RMN80794.1 hypothetical protein ALQ53_102920 [Pseudomonas cannabina]